ISGNNNNGILISGPSTFTSGNVVQGNFIGTDVTGTRALPNGFNGVEVRGPNNLIGGPGPGAPNIISGHGVEGVAVGAGGPDRDNRVEGNYIGTDVTGTLAVGNGNGVEVAGTINTTIGGTAAGAGNLISGNRNVGIITRSDPGGLRIQGNLIGT